MVVIAGAAAIAAAALAGRAVWGDADGGRSDGPIAVVLAQQPDRLVAVDLERMMVVREAPLRSFAIGMDVDPATGLAVTAQCGGVGDRADDVAGIWDPRTGGSVRYVKLPRPNPRVVVAVGGRALLDHGWLERERLAVSPVRPGAGAPVSGPLWLPDGTGAIGGAGGALWALGPAPGRKPGTDDDDSPVGVVLGRLDPATGVYAASTSTVPGCNAVRDGGGGVGYLFGGGWDAEGPRAGDVKAWVAEFDTRTGAVRTRVEVPGMRQGFFTGCVTPDHVVAADWANDEPDREGRQLVVLSRADLRVLRTVPLPAGPCSIASWGSRIVVLERRTGRLAVMDPATGRLEGSVAIGGPFIAGVVRVDAAGR